MSPRQPNRASQGASRPPRPASGWPIASVASALYPEATAEHLASLAHWLDELVRWNAKIDLTAARDALELTDLMVADACVVAKHLAPGERVLDVGAGAGAPGLAVALLRPDVRVTLSEPLAKRTSFLRSVLASLGRTDVQVTSLRGEDIGRGAFDTAMARATLPPAEWLTLGRTLSKRVLVFLARDPAPEAPDGMTRGVEPYTWPLTSADRTLAIYEG